MKNSIGKLSLVFLMALLGVVSVSQASPPSGPVFEPVLESEKPITAVCKNTFIILCKAGIFIKDYLSEACGASVALSGIACKYPCFTASVVVVGGCCLYHYYSLYQQAEHNRRIELRNQIARHCVGCYRGGGCQGIVGRY